MIINYFLPRGYWIFLLLDKSGGIIKAWPVTADETGFQDIELPGYDPVKSPPGAHFGYRRVKDDDRASQSLAEWLRARTALESSIPGDEHGRETETAP